MVAFRTPMLWAIGFIVVSTTHGFGCRRTGPRPRKPRASGHLFRSGVRALARDHFQEITEQFCTDVT